METQQGNQGLVVKKEQVAKLLHPAVKAWSVYHVAFQSFLIVALGDSFKSERASKIPLKLPFI